MRYGLESDHNSCSLRFAALGIGTHSEKFLKIIDRRTEILGIRGQQQFGCLGVAPFAAAKIAIRPAAPELTAKTLQPCLYCCMEHIRTRSSPASFAEQSGIQLISPLFFQLQYNNRQLEQHRQRNLIKRKDLGPNMQHLQIDSRQFSASLPILRCLLRRLQPSLQMAR